MGKGKEGDGRKERGEEGGKGKDALPCSLPPFCYMCSTALSTDRF